MCGVHGFVSGEVRRACVNYNANVLKHKAHATILPLTLRDVESLIRTKCQWKSTATATTTTSTNIRRQKYSLALPITFDATRDPLHRYAGPAPHTFVLTHCRLSEIAAEKQNGGG